MKFKKDIHKNNETSLNNSKQERAVLKKRLEAESKICAKDSILILSEFEKLDDTALDK